MTKTYIHEKGNKVIRFSNDNKNKGNHDILELQGLSLDTNTIEVLNDILSNGNYRERTILENFGAIGEAETPYKDSVINVYNKQGESFQVFVKSTGGYEKGTITN